MTAFFMLCLFEAKGQEFHWKSILHVCCYDTGRTTRICTGPFTQIHAAANTSRADCSEFPRKNGTRRVTSTIGYRTVRHALAAANNAAGKLATYNPCRTGRVGHNALR